MIIDHVIDLKDPDGRLAVNGTLRIQMVDPAVAIAIASIYQAAEQSAREVLIPKPSREDYLEELASSTAHHVISDAIHASREPGLVPTKRKKGRRP